MSKIGVDISTYQKNVNYDEAVNHIEFAIIRVGYGVSYMPDSQRDTEFDNHYNGFKNKIPLGAYYYAYGTNYDTGVKEAENCLAYMGDKTFEMPIFYDMEENRNTKEAGQGFVDRIRQAGLKAGIYASSYFYKTKGLAEIDCDSVWIAEYGSNNGQIPSSKPSVNYNIWQYTSKGSVSGIGNNIDMDITDDDTPQPTPPEPPIPPQPSGDEQIRDIQEWCNTYSCNNIAVDGIYGSKTKSAIIKVYQTELNRQFNAGLSVDGIFGQATKKATPEVYPGAVGNITKSIQSELYCRGYNTNGVDGIYGNATYNAIKSFQANHNLAIDGYYGKNTGYKLYN